jgi:hypothetical protein
MGYLQFQTLDNVITYIYEDESDRYETKCGRNKDGIMRETERDILYKDDFFIYRLNKDTCLYT